MMRLVGLRLLDENELERIKMPNLVVVTAKFTPNLVVVTAKFTPNLAVWTDFIFYSR